jgi:hypothetical protein
MLSEEKSGAYHYIHIFHLREGSVRARLFMNSHRPVASLFIMQGRLFYMHSVFQHGRRDAALLK